MSFGGIAFLDSQLVINGPPRRRRAFHRFGEDNPGTIRNITAPAVSGIDATGPLDIPEFITFAADPNISITLTYLLPGN